MVVAFLFGSIGILQGIYAKYFGMALTTIATVLLISRLFDAITDPLIGYFSDRYYAKHGSRKPFVMIGGLLLILSSYFLYVPIDPNNLTATTVVSTVYFSGWYLLFYLAWTLVEIPHLAWGSEITSRTHEKNKIYSFRALSVNIGLLLFYLVPLLPFFETNEFTPQSLLWTAVSACVLMLIALYYCIRLVPDGPRPRVSKDQKQSLWALRKEIFSNKLFLLFVTATAMYGVGVFMWFTLMFIFVDAFLGLSGSFALLSLIGLCISILLTGFWYWMANRTGKKLTWAFGVLLYIMGLLIAVFLEPDNASVVALAFVMVLAFVGPTAVTILSPSLLSDIVDYSTWKFGTDRTATYFSVYALVYKTSIAIGGSIGLGLSGWYGFDPSALVHTDESIFGLRLAACWLPILFLLLSVVLMSWVPMNAHRHGVIRQRLDARLRRQSNPCKQHLPDDPMQTLDIIPS